MSEDRLIKAICENCGQTFFATWDCIDHTGFIQSIRSGSGQVMKDFTFCCYDCEKAFVERMEKRHPEIKGGWKPADPDQMERFPKYYKERTCALCGSKKKLKLSHVIPRFISKWLKETSASGFLRTIDPGNRIQDTYKINLLCEDCEELFSAWENHFAEELFYPYQEGNKELPYDERLAKFAVSIAWRLLRVHLYELTDDSKTKGYAEAALETWKDYLLGKRVDPGPYENHVFFLDALDISSIELPSKFLWYALRSIDGRIVVYDDGRIFTFAKLPGVLLVSSINPTVFRGWKVSRIDRNGKIGLPQEVIHTEISQFLIKRSSVMTQFSLSEEEQNKIANALRNRRDRVLRSGTLQTLLAEGKRRRSKIIDKLNPAVKQLVEIVECAEAKGEISLETRALADFGLHLIADTLVELSSIKAEQLAKETLEAILRSKSTASDCSSVSDLGDIVVMLHVCPHSSREQRIKKIEESFLQIEKDGLFQTAEEILVLAWNPSNHKPSFDLSCEIR